MHYNELNDIEIVVAKFSSLWYTTELKALEEPKLFSDSLFKQVFRFTWLRTFHKSIATRMEKENNKIKFYWKVCAGKVGYNHGKLAIDKSKELSEKE